MSAATALERGLAALGVACARRAGEDHEVLRYREVKPVYT